MGMKKKKKKILKKKIENGRLKKTKFFKIANSQKKNCENFMDWSLG
jgi:hypothetical protein